jgi:A/G-specific adenine glycosylase
MQEKPFNFVQRSLSWFSSNGRDFPWRRETDPYRILVAEKLLQQTTYGHVMKVYETFFEKFPGVKSLADADVSEIESVIRRLGFQRQRARQFKKIAQAIVDEFNGVVPSRKDDLLKLSGVGNYVASAVLCFAFNKDEAIVDMNVRRVVERVFGWKGVSDKEIANRLSKMIPKGKAKQFNWAIIDFSSIVCSRKPKCNICFLNDLCLYYAQSKLNVV